MDPIKDKLSLIAITLTEKAEKAEKAGKNKHTIKSIKFKGISEADRVETFHNDLIFIVHGTYNSKPYEMKVFCPINMYDPTMNSFINVSSEEGRRIKYEIQKDIEKALDRAIPRNIK